MHITACALAVKALLSTAASAALLLAPATAHATEIVPTTGSSVTEPPPGSSTPIGPAVYPGDPVAARFLGDDVRVRSYPGTGDGRIVSVGQRFHRVDAHCYRYMSTPVGGRSDLAWVYVTHRTAGERGWVYSRHLAAGGAIRVDRVLPRCSPGV